MGNNTQTWTSVTKNIFSAVLLISAMSLLWVIMGAIGKIWDITSPDEGTNLFTVLMWVCLVGLIAGYLLYIMGLGHLKAITNEHDSQAAGHVRAGAVTFMLAIIIAGILGLVLCGLPSWLGWLVRVVELVAHVMMLMGFSALMKSTANGVKAARGFSQLFMAMLLISVAILLNLVFCWIPILNTLTAIIAVVLVLGALTMTVTGWATVKNSPAR